MCHSVLEDTSQLAGMSQHLRGNCPFSCSAGVVVKIKLGGTRDGSRSYIFTL